MQVMVLKLNDDANLSDAEKILRTLKDSETLRIDQGWMAIDGDAEMVLDVFRHAELGAGLHVADVREENAVISWVLEHSLVCRRTGKMADCPFIEHLKDADEEGLLEAGRYSLTLLPESDDDSPRLHLKLMEPT